MPESKSGKSKLLTKKSKRGKNQLEKPAEDMQFYHQLFSYFNQFSKETGADKYILENSSVLRIPKGKALIKAGETNSSIFFIAKGVVRGFMRYAGQEITTWINDENEIVATIRNFEIPQPSNEELQAIEDMVCIEIPREVLEYVYNAYPETNRIGRLILALNYRDAEERAYISRIPTAEGRYRRFLEHQGNLITRIPLKYIASYLGMKVETLSRIRSKIK